MERAEKAEVVDCLDNGKGERKDGTTDSSATITKGVVLYSPTNSQQTVSDDDEEIDYSVKPEFYDPKLDDKDEKWVHKKRRGRDSDAVLSCPACFTTLCLECQRHERYVTQFRAMFVVNCKIASRIVQYNNQKSKRGKTRKESGETDNTPANGETFKPASCSVCRTEVGVIDEDEVYHFFNVLPSDS